ncbi:hypothetical protein, partial [Helicobacter pylori]|uniref:hypothetical protein n=1 Tax=Helicobacter pylori TaxID=210 RepID=UPI0012AE4F17
MADKYLLFIPFFIEAKGIAKDEGMFFKRLELRVHRQRNERKKMRTLDHVNRVFLKWVGTFGIQQNEMRFIFFIYLLHLGLYNVAVANTLIKPTYTLMEQLGIT